MTKNELVVWDRQADIQCTDLIPKPEEFTIGLPKPKSLELMDDADIVLPVLDLLQSTSKPVQNGVEGAKPGLFMLSTTEEIFEPPLRVFLVFMHNGRFKPEGDPHGTPMCKSQDGIVGTRFGSCDACEHKEWREDEKGRNVRDCSDTRNFFCLLPNGTPAVLRFYKSRFKTATEFLTRARTEGKDLWAHPAVVRVQQAQNPEKGNATYYTATLSWDVRDITPPSWCEAAEQVFDELKAGWESKRLAFDTDEDLDGM